MGTGKTLGKHWYRKHWYRKHWYQAPLHTHAFFTPEQSDELVLKFDQQVVWSDALTSQFYPDGESGQVASGSANGTCITLKSSSKFTKVTYLDSKSLSPGNLLDGENGIAALTFCDVPVEAEYTWRQMCFFLVALTLCCSGNSARRPTSQVRSIRAIVCSASLRVAPIYLCSNRSAAVIAHGKAAHMSQEIVRIPAVPGKLRFHPQDQS